jgi:hypothetical protein
MAVDLSSNGVTARIGYGRHGGKHFDPQGRLTIARRFIAIRFHSSELLVWFQKYHEQTFLPGDRKRDEFDIGENRQSRKLPILP